MTEQSISADAPAKPKAKMSWRDDTLRKRLRDAIRRIPRSKKDKKLKKPAEVSEEKPPTAEPSSIERTETPDTSTNVGTVGSILALRPREPLALLASTSVYEACKYMAAKHADCVLVLDNDGSVSGIFTARDVALSVVGESKKARDTLISDIMASDPAVATADVSALEALDLMASRSIRHLPVVAADDAGDDAGAVLGVLDLSRLMIEAATLNTDNEHSIPTLAEVISAAGESARPLTIDLNASVAQAAKMMRDNNSTAVLVADSNSNQISGIITSKDIVNRALAVDLDPALVSVLRIMTPRPESAVVKQDVHEALRMMHRGNYLNLPVLTESGDIAGVVDALTLTYVALAHLRALSAIAEQGQEPWNKFWLSLEESTPEPELAATPSQSALPPSQAPSLPETETEVSEPAAKNLTSEPEMVVQPLPEASTPTVAEQAQKVMPEVVHKVEPDSVSQTKVEPESMAKDKPSRPRDTGSGLPLSVLSLSVLSLSVFAFYAYKRHI